MSPNVKTGRRLSGSHQGHDWRRIAVGTFTWRGKTTLIAIRTHQDGLLLQRLYFANEVYNATEIDQGTEPKIRDQERTLAERLISELSETEFQPEKYEDEYRQRS
jgi:DNA end-binding protein Ku